MSKQDPIATAVRLLLQKLRDKVATGWKPSQNDSDWLVFYLDILRRAEKKSKCAAYRIFK